MALTGNKIDERFAVTAIRKMTKFVLKKPVDELVAEPKDPQAAMKEVLSLVFQHTAEVFELIVGAVSEHYKIDKAEMMDVILKNPAYINRPTSVILEVPKPVKNSYVPSVHKSTSSSTDGTLRKKFAIKKSLSHPE